MFVANSLGEYWTLVLYDATLIISLISAVRLLGTKGTRGGIGVSAFLVNALHVSNQRNGKLEGIKEFSEKFWPPNTEM